MVFRTPRKDPFLAPFWDPKKRPIFSDFYISITSKTTNQWSISVINIYHHLCWMTWKKRAKKDPKNRPFSTPFWTPKNTLFSTILWDIKSIQALKINHMSMKNIFIYTHIRATTCERPKKVKKTRFLGARSPPAPKPSPRKVGFFGFLDTWISRYGAHQNRMSQNMKRSKKGQKQPFFRGPKNPQKSCFFVFFRRCEALWTQWNYCCVVYNINDVLLLRLIKKFYQNRLKNRAPKRAKKGVKKGVQKRAIFEGQKRPTIYNKLNSKDVYNRTTIH